MENATCQICFFHINHILVSDWIIDCFAVILHSVVLRKTTMDWYLFLNLISSTFDCREDFICGTVSQCTESPKQRTVPCPPALLSKTDKDPAVSGWLILSKFLRSSDRLLEVMFSNASPSPPTAWPAPAAQCCGWGCSSRVGRVGRVAQWDSSGLLWGHLS